MDLLLSSKMFCWNRWMLLHILWYCMIRAWARFCRMGRWIYKQSIGMITRERSAQDILIQSFWIAEECSKQEFPDMINIVSCDLHNVHRAFKSGMKASKWHLAKILKGNWHLFQDYYGEIHTWFAKVKISHCGMFVYDQGRGHVWKSGGAKYLVT